jgi:hypothetical protein
VRGDGDWVPGSKVLIRVSAERKDLLGAAGKEGKIRGV